MGNHQASQLICKFLIIRQLLLQSICCSQNQIDIIVTYILGSLMKITVQLSNRYSFSSYLIKAMSIYDNKASNIYPDLNPTVPQQSQTYRLKKLTEIEAYLLNKIQVRKRLTKKMKIFNMITSIVDTGLIISTNITGGFSITAKKQKKNDAIKLFAQSKLQQTLYDSNTHGELKIVRVIESYSIFAIFCINDQFSMILCIRKVPHLEKIQR